jgi:SMC interacting uncharacterized protein involved in chromosome segregation
MYHHQPQHITDNSSNMYNDDDYVVSSYEESQPPQRQAPPPTFHSFLSEQPTLDNSTLAGYRQSTTTTSRVHHHHTTSHNTSLFDDVELGEQLSSQIEYNNQLLRTVQDMERKSQEGNRAMEKKNQDLRLLKNEVAQLRAQIDNLEETNYQNQVQIENQKKMFDEVLRKEREDLDSRLDQREDEIEELRSQIITLETHVDRTESE